MVREWKERKTQVTENNGNIVSHRQSSGQLQRSKPPRLPSPEELRQAELIMIKTVQKENFDNEIEILRKPMSKEKGRRQTGSVGVLKSSSAHRLDPFLDKDGVLQVKGRLRRSNREFVEKHPKILSKKHQLSSLVIRHYHHKVHQQGRLITLGAVRRAGFWIIGASRMVAKTMNNCVSCRKLQGKFLTQHMADLPSERTETPPPFTIVGLDVFEPYTIHTKRTRGETVNAKRWGLVFTCLSSRAIHI